MIIFCCVKYKVKSSYYSTTPYANMQQKAIRALGGFSPESRLALVTKVGQEKLTNQCYI